MYHIEFIDLSNNSHNETRSQEEIFQAKNILQQLKVIFIVVPAVLIAIGLPGNILTIFVLHRKAMADEMVARYLISMCYFSMATLIFVLPTFFNKATIGVEVPTNSEPLCQLYRYCSTTLVAITNWSLVLVTFVRYFETIIRSEKLEDYYIRPCLTVFFVCFVLIAAQIPIIWNWVLFERNGVVVECYLPSGTSLFHLEMAIQVIVPFCSLILPNLFIYLHTFKPPPVFDETDLDPILKVRKELYILVTISNVQFMVTSLPLMLYPYAKAMYDEEKIIDRLKSQMLLGGVLLFQYSSYALNVVLYSIFDKKFRKEFFKVVRACKRLCERKKQIILDDLLEPPRRASGASRYSRASRSSRVSRFSQSSKRAGKVVVKPPEPEPDSTTGTTSPIDPVKSTKRNLPKPIGDDFFFF